MLTYVARKFYLLGLSRELFCDGFEMPFFCRKANQTARASLCVAQNVPTYISKLQQQLLNSFKETNFSESNLPGDIYVLFQPKKNADKSENSSENSIKLSVVQFQRHRRRKTEENHKPHISQKKQHQKHLCFFGNWPILMICHLLFNFSLK